MSHIEDFYAKLFTAEGGNINLEEILNCIPHLVMEEINQQLIRPVSLVEVKEACFCLNPTKSPGADGYTARFFQKHWELIKDDLFSAVRTFFQSGFMILEMNKTNVVLIPKTAEPEVISHFRPIALCNVVYKLISKVLVLRLKCYLNNASVQFPIQ